MNKEAQRYFGSFETHTICRFAEEVILNMWRRKEEQHKIIHMHLFMFFIRNFYGKEIRFKKT
jgi:hypothetical protein